MVYIQYVFQYIITHWWLFFLSLVAAILELYVIPNVIAWYQELNSPNYRRFSVLAACILFVTFINFVYDILQSDPTHAYELKNTANSDEISMPCGCNLVCTCNSVTSSSDTETVTQSYVDSLMLASKDRELTIDELEGLTQEELALLRNAIFAMAGMQYDYGSKYDNIFQTYDWYNPYIPRKDFSWDIFNSYQHRNMNIIVSYEKSKGYRK